MEGGRSKRGAPLGYFYVVDPAIAKAFETERDTEKNTEGGLQIR